MGKRRYIFKKVVGIVLVMILLCLPLRTVFGASNTEKLVMSLDQLISKAVDSSSQLKKMYLSADSTYEQIDSIRTIEDAAYTNIDVYNALKLQEQTDLDAIENYAEGTAEHIAADADLATVQFQLVSVTAALASVGLNADDLSEEEQYIHIVKAFQFQRYELALKEQNAVVNKKVIQAGIENSMRSLYDSIINLNDSLSLQENMLKSQKDKYSAALLKYQYGRISQLDRDTAVNDLQKAKMSMDQSTRSLTNQYLMLKRQTGISLAQDVEIEGNESLLDANSMLSMDEYLKDALSNRYEVVSALNTLTLKKREFDIAKDYVSLSSIEYKDAEEAVYESEVALEEAQNSVTKDIKLGYEDVFKKKSTVDVAQKNQDISEQKYNDMKKRYEAGSISQTMLSDFEASYEQSKANYSKAQRDLSTAIYELKAASLEGPKYVDQGGMGI